VYADREYVVAGGLMSLGPGHRQGDIGGCRPECGWNSVWRILREHESIVSGNKVNRLIDWFCGDGLPTIDLAHVDLS
jgi:hypothetical protein